MSNRGYRVPALFSTIGMCYSSVKAAEGGGDLLGIPDFLSSFHFDEYLSVIKDGINEISEELVSWLELTDFQILLLQNFVLLLIANLTLVLIAWKMYRGKISHHFYTEEGISNWQEKMVKLRSDLQLPTDHDFKHK